MHIGSRKQSPRRITIPLVLPSACLQGRSGCPWSPLVLCCSMENLCKASGRPPPSKGGGSGTLRSRTPATLIFHSWLRVPCPEKPLDPRLPTDQHAKIGRCVCLCKWSQRMENLAPFLGESSRETCFLWLDLIEKVGRGQSWERRSGDLLSQKKQLYRCRESQPRHHQEKGGPTARKSRLQKLPS